MLKTIDLIESIGQEYTEMLSTVNIPNFYKCIAQYAGIPVQELKDRVILEYLTHWAKNKKHIYDFLGATQIDLPIDYLDEGRDFKNKLLEIAKKYPAYYTWLTGMNRQTSNKLDAEQLNWDIKDMISECFPDYKYNGEAITHFFKSKLNAPDQLISMLANVYDNLEMKGIFTISIDPVDIMLSSENPYNWQSCYRLATDNEESHADGCLAGVLDTCTIITYIWDEISKKFDLYTYTLKDIRCKRIRMTIATNDLFNAIHFNTIYPGKGSYSEGFNKLLRGKVETVFAEKLNKENIWCKNEYNNKIYCQRHHTQYGYNEYSDISVWKLKGEKEYHNIYPYDTYITCPCGCGNDYYGTDNYWNDEEELEYNGQGHVNENYYETNCGTYCDISGEYEECDGYCEDCSLWRRENSYCELDTSPCEQYDTNDLECQNMADFTDSRVISCDPEYCENCPRYREHHPEEFEEIEIIEVN